MTHRLPEFFSFNQLIGLFPEMMLVQGAVIPTITHDSMLAWSFSRKVRSLSRAGKSGERWPNDPLAPFVRSGKRGKMGSVRTEMPLAKAHHIEHDGSRVLVSLTVAHCLNFAKGNFSFPKIFDGIENFFLIHGVDFHTFTDSLNESDS